MGHIRPNAFSVGNSMFNKRTQGFIKKEESPPLTTHLYKIPGNAT